MDKLKALQIPDRIVTRRLSLTRLRYEDAEEIFYTYASKPESTRFVAWPTHQSINDTREFLRRAVAGWNQGFDFSFAIRLLSNGRFLGCCGFLNDEGKAQLGYVLGPLHWGQGFATEAACKLIEVLKNRPEVYRVGSFVDTENIASIKVLLKAGMEEEAVLHKWYRFPNQANEPKDCILFRLP